MEDTRVKASSESQPQPPTPTTKSKFDDVEYARWSELLRARSKRK